MNNIEPEGKTLISLELARHQFRQLMETEKKQLINLQKLGQTTCFLGSEKNIDHRFTIEVNNEKIPVQVIGKIDRIHQTGNCVWIIDYKTGKVEEKELKIQSFEDLQKSEKRKALQLAIYGWAMKKSYPQFELITGIVSTVKPTEKPYVLVHNGEPIMYSDETVGHIQNALTGIMNDLLDPAKPFIHNTKSRFCHYC